MAWNGRLTRKRQFSMQNVADWNLCFGKHLRLRRQENKEKTLTSAAAKLKYPSHVHRFIIAKMI